MINHHKLAHKHFTANGKLLITGEYLVLDGAAALAVPIKLGQSLSVESSDSHCLNWTASDINGIWFEGVFNLADFSIVTTSDQTTALTLQNILKRALELSHREFPTTGYIIKTSLNYDRYLGVGSSSTLIALVASLFEIDKFKLHRLVSSGSGYDVACADYNHPIIYTRPSSEFAIIKPVNFLPPFSDKLWFIYHGNKQDTNAEITNYKNIDRKSLARIDEITYITQKIMDTKELTTFVSLSDLHEKIIGEIIGRTAIKQLRFSDFKGSLKSLGAWGGDFILAACELDETYITEYFRAHNINTIFRFNDLVLNKPVLNNDEIIIRF